MLVCLFVNPQHIIIDSLPASSRAPLIIAIISLLISIGSFLFSLKQFTFGKKSAWFHKIAVDPMLNEIFAFYDGVKAELVECAIKHQIQLSGSSRKTVAPNITKALTAFSSQSTDMYEDVATRVDVFNSIGAQDIRLLAERHQDSIAAAIFRGKKDVTEALDTAKRELIAKLRKCDI